MRTIIMSTTALLVLVSSTNVVLGKLKINLDALSEIYPAGTSIPVRYSAESIGASWSWEMTAWGTPYVPRLTLTGPNGKDVPYRRLPGGGPPGAAPANTRYVVMAGASVRFCHDLAEVYELDRPGTYTLKIWDVEVAAEASFRVLAGVAGTVHELKGAFALLPLGEKSITTPVSCHASTLTVKDRVLHRRFAVIDGVSVSGILRDDVPKSAFAIRDDSEISRAEIDYLGTVWMVLKSGDEEGLLIWSLHGGEFLMLVPLDKHRIDVGVSYARSGSRLLTIVAGVRGGVMHTSSSVQRTDARTARPATRPAN